MNSNIILSEQFEKIRSNLYFILVEPESPGNVGAAARALKTSGFEKLILVNPPNLDLAETKMLAHRSMDIIRNAKIVPSFAQAVGPMHLTIGTTMRNRRFKFPLYHPQELAQKILPVALEQPVAIIFGHERTGLTNEELFTCQLHSTIPTATQNPSLNLAQAVMLYAHTFFLRAQQTFNKYNFDLATQYELEKFYVHLGTSLKEVNFSPRNDLEDFLIRVRRFFGRAMAEKRDIRLLYKLLQIFQTRIRDLKKQTLNDEKRKIF